MLETFYFFLFKWYLSELLPSSLPGWPSHSLMNFPPILFWILHSFCTFIVPGKWGKDLVSGLYWPLPCSYHLEMPWRTSAYFLSRRPYWGHSEELRVFTRCPGYFPQGHTLCVHSPRHLGHPLHQRSSYPRGSKVRSHPRKSKPP